MKKVACVISIFVLVTAVGLSLFVYFVAPVTKTKHNNMGDVDIIDVYCENVRDSYEVVCETGNKNLNVQCFIIEPVKKFHGTIVVNRSLDQKMLVYSKDNRGRIQTFSFPDPGNAQRGGGASWGRLYYLEWNEETDQTNMAYFQVVVRKMGENQ